jgi:carboxypeptidase Taq
MNACKFLEEVLYKINTIEKTLNILNHSKLSIEDKIEQITLLEEIKYEIITHDVVKESLIAAPNKRSNWKLESMEKIYKANNALPLDLIKSLSKTRIECSELLKLSRSEASNLRKLKKHFVELVKLMRDVASIKAQNMKCSKYDAMLMDGITEQDIKEIFPKIGNFFNKNIDEIVKKQSKEKIAELKNFTIEEQVKLGLVCLQHIGIGNDEMHTLSIDYDESDFCYSLSSLLRYSSDAMYQKQLIKNFAATEVIREVQGLFMEKMLGTSMEFTEFIQPYIQDKVKARSSNIKNLFYLFNKVNLSFLLKKADEFTLLAHIMLRTKLEKDIIDGKLEVKDLQDSWLEGMKHYRIPVKAKNELETYFQDEYWIDGVIGYFPMKMVALISSAQIFSFLKENHYEYLDNIKKGNFSLLINWFAKNIYGTKYNISETLKKVTGETLNVECYTKYLNAKYNLMDCV